ncbi:MAG: efflux RND transporter periplasmic adaptor subunit [Sphingomonadales bacterium]|nr:efflux RND transporter periplasmic adaptor subunit [Sphingomonadales bacterium]
MDKRILLAGAAALTFSGVILALRDTGSVPAPAVADRPAGELAPDELARLGIHTEAAVVADAVPLASVPAQVSLPPEARVAVTSPFAGVITQLLVIPGQQVTRGQALAMVHAAEPVQFGAELTRAEADLPVLRASATRLGQLAREGIIAPARAEEAQAALRRGEASVAEQRRLLAMAGAAASGSVTLRAPIDGRLASVAVETGQSIGNAAAPFIVENISALRLELQLPERLAGKVRPGMEVEVPVEGGSTVVRGKVLSVAASLDPQTHSLAARATLATGALLVPGKAVTVVIRDGSRRDGLSVSSTAVTRIGNDDCVFVHDGRRFVRRVVKVAAEAGGRSFVTAGLHPGEKVAMSGVAELKSLLSGQ